MTPLAREVRRAMVATRKLQRARNLEAMGEEQKRQDSMRSGPKMERISARENKMVPNPAEGNKLEEGEPLEVLGWASKHALALAQDHGLRTVDFNGQEASGKTGFNTADVRRVVDALNDWAENA